MDGAGKSAKELAVIRWEASPLNRHRRKSIMGIIKSGEALKIGEPNEISTGDKNDR